MPRHQRRSRGRLATILRAVGITAAVALVATLSITGIAAWSLVHGEKASVAFHAVAPSGKAVASAPPLSAYRGEVNMLVVASDTRTGQGTGFDDAKNLRASSGVGQNDSNLLIHINQQHTSMDVIDLPRDLVVSTPACERNDGSMGQPRVNVMLNTSLIAGGANHGLECVATAVAALTGVQIDYAAMIQFDGVVKMTTAIGGVSVCLATPIVDDEVTPALNLSAGTHLLQGAQAAAFLRTRYGVGYGGDTARISNQQVFMSALMRQAVSQGTLSNPVKLYRLASAALQSVDKSPSLTVPTLVTIALAIKNIGLSNIVFLQYPSLPDPENSAHLLPDPAGAAVLKQALASNAAIQLSPGSLGQSAVLASPAASTSPSSSASSSASAPSKAPAVVLPGTSTGQSAAQQTCSGKGR